MKGMCDMADGRKVTWKMIYSDFKALHPNLKKEVIHWHPHEFATIMLYFKNKDKATYNYDTKEVYFIKHV